MKRTATGIQGFDELIEGGFPESRSVLLSGACGTGKTILSMQYLYNGAKKYAEPGIYVTLDERPELIRQDVKRFGWDLKRLEDEKMIQIIDGSIAKLGLDSEEEFSLPSTGFDLDKLLLEIMRVGKRIGAKRIVVDSIPSLGFNFDNENEVRNAILKIGFMLTKLGATSIMISEVEEGESKFSKYGVEEFVADGVVSLHYMSVGTRSNRTLHIRKMRSTKHSEDLHPIEITDDGIKVHRIEDEYDD